MNKVMHAAMQKTKLIIIAILSLFSFTILSGAVLASSTVSADDVVDQVNITVPVACTMNGTGINTHNAEIANGTYNSAIGETTLKAFCNDNEGFAVYAIGYTDNEEGKNVLASSALGSTHDIATGTATSGNNSNWAMKLSTVSSPAPTYPITIQNSFDSFHNIPDGYTLVAKRTSGTDTGTNAEGSTLKTTYQAYISKTQSAGTYTGQVKYTLVHPHNAPTPIPISKNLYYAITGDEGDYTLTISDSDITSGAVASGPVAIDGYTFDEDEWVSTTPWDSYAYEITSVVVSGIAAPTSTNAWFAKLENCESWNLSGLRTDHVTDMSNMFAYAGSNATTFTLDLSSWNTSSVTDMSYMFHSAGSDATTWSVGNLSSWNTSSVTNMSGMFYSAGSNATTFTLDLSSWNTSSVTDMSDMFNYAGYSATTWSVGDLSSWNTSNVTDMSYMFSSAGYSATTFTLDLSSWNTSNVTNMVWMFNSAGYSATTFTLDLSSWNTSNVINMDNMFYAAGSNATTWSVTIPKTNNGTTTGSITNTTSRLYGKTTSRYATPPSGRSFTLAN